MEQTKERIEAMSRICAGMTLEEMQNASFDYKSLVEIVQRREVRESAAAASPVAWRVHPFDYGVGSDGVYALTMRPDQVEAWRRKGWDVQPFTKRSNRNERTEPRT